MNAAALPYEKGILQCRSHACQRVTDCGLCKTQPHPGGGQCAFAKNRLEHDEEVQVDPSQSAKARRRICSREITFVTYHKQARLIADHRARARPQKIVFPPLGDGLFGEGAGSHELFVQGFVSSGDRRGRFDELVGYGDVVVVHGGDATIASDIATLARANGVKIVRIGGGATGDLVEEDNGYATWFASHDCTVAAIRRDFHVWGTANASGIDSLVRDFVHAMSMPKHHLAYATAA